MDKKKEIAKSAANEADKRAKYKYAYINIVEIKGKQYIVGMDKEEEVMVFWDTRTADWKVFRDSKL